MLRDKVTLIDIDDNEIGIASKTEAHQRPMLHRAFSIFLYNSENKLLIQKRAASKYHSPNLWANTCCSHPQSGENIKESALERLKDEMGIETNIEEIFSFIYMNKFHDELYEYEYDHVFIGKYDGKFELNEEEASEAKWVGLQELKNELKNNPTSFSSWFIIAAPKVISFLENKKIG